MTARYRLELLHHIINCTLRIVAYFYFFGTFRILWLDLKGSKSFMV